jgi:hypothetical protein
MILTPEHKQLLFQIVRGHADAAEFCIVICEILHTWDDLIDKDKPVSPETINKTFWIALVDLPRNPFYQQHAHDLIPCLMLAIQNWHAANEMELNQSETDKEIAFILRSSYADVVIQAAFLVGGYEWARQITPKVRREFHKETYAGYRGNLEKQFSDAAQVAGGD